MIHIDALCGIGTVSAPIPDGISLLNAESFLRRRFEKQRAVINVCGIYGTGELEFDLDTPGSMPADYQAPRSEPTYQAALNLTKVEIATRNYFEAVKVMRCISSAWIDVSSAAGGNPIFSFGPSIITGVKL